MSLIPTPSKSDYFTALRAFLLSVLPAGIEVVQGQQNEVPSPAGPDYVILTEIGRRRLSTNIETYADCSFSGFITGSTLTVSAVHLGTILPGAILLGEAVANGTTIAAQQSGPTGGAGVYTLSQTQPAPISGVSLASGVANFLAPTEVTIQTDVYGPNSADNAQTIATLFRDGFASLWFFRQGYAARGINVLDIGDPRQMPFVDAEQNYEERWSADLKLQVDQVVSPSQDFADSVTIRTTIADALNIGMSVTESPTGKAIVVSTQNVLGSEGSGDMGAGNRTFRLLSSSASTNATLVSGSPCRVYGIQGESVAAGRLYLKLYDQTTMPNVGVDTPVKTLALPAGGVFVVDLGGFAFQFGLGFALTGAPSDSDTTPVPAGEIMTLNIDWSA